MDKGLHYGAGLSYSSARTTADTFGLREAEDTYAMIGGTVGNAFE